MTFQLNPSSGIPLYVQLVEQVKHAIDTGAVRTCEQLPSVRQMAEDLLINPSTVVRAYRELEHEGIIELKHGCGAFICATMVARGGLMHKAQTIVQSAITRLESLNLNEEEIRRLVENELASGRKRKQAGKKYA